MNHNQIHLNLSTNKDYAPLLANAIEAMYSRAAGSAPTSEIAAQIGQNTTTLLTDSAVSAKRIALTLTEEEANLLVAVEGEEGAPAFALPLPYDGAPQTSSDATTPEGLGMGIHLIRELMDEVAYLPETGNNCWRLVKQLLVAEQPDGNVAGESLIQLDLPVGLKYLNVLGEAIGALLGQIKGLDDREKTTYIVQLAAQEACANIVYHAYGENAQGRINVTLTLANNPAQITIELKDSGENTFDLEAIPNPFPLSPPVKGGLLSGSAMLFVSMTIVNAGNYLFNLVLGRWLGPAAFADLSLIVTLMLMITLITATFQTVAAKFSAVHAAAESLSALAGVRDWLGKRAWLFGIAAMLLFGLGAPLWQQFFHTASFVPFIILGVGLPVYFSQGVDRGVLQGQTRFGLLSLSYQAEMWVRLIGAIALVAMGFSVNGAVGGLTMSFVGAWLVARQVKRGLPGSKELTRDEKQVIILYAGPVIAALIGQILINNSDILIVKHFFPSEEAGKYAALALIGRIVFFATWSIVTTLFPIVAQKHEKGEAHRYLLWLSLGIVLATSAGIILFSYLFPNFIVGILFGKAYLSVAPLLWLYAIATMLYALANVIITYRLSIGNGGGSYLAVVAGAAQVMGLWFFHASLLQVVMVQIYLMSAFLLMLLLWDTWLTQWRS